MKKLIITSVLAVLVALGTTVMAQENPAEYLGLPGDNLNLYAVMKLFQESQTLEGFEKALNDENSRINNLDLNGDGMIDYITVSDYVDGDVHTIVLRAVLNKNESQDVAVFTVQRFNNGSVQIQLIGDEELYGKNYIIEPIYDDNNGTPNPGYMGTPSNQINITVVRTSPYEIAAWPLVRFIYLPTYMPWHSSWYWGYYPSFWHPWSPFSWNFYYGYHYYWYNDYYAHFHRWDHYRYPRYNDFYYRGIRSYSPMVGERIRDGRFRDTYSHPEQRREGEALFARTNPGMERRRPDNQGMNNQSGRSANQGNSMSNRSRYNTPSNQNTDVSRNRTAAPDRSGNRNGQTQKSNSSDQTQRSMSRPQQNQRSISRPTQSKRSETARSARQSAPRANSSARSSRQERASSPSRSSSKSSSGTKSSKSDKNSRR